jgi:hypothetical protein
MVGVSYVDKYGNEKELIARTTVQIRASTKVVSRPEHYQCPRHAWQWTVSLAIPLYPSSIPHQRLRASCTAASDFSHAAEGPGRYGSEASSTSASVGQNTWPIRNFGGDLILMSNFQVPTSSAAAAAAHLPAMRPNTVPAVKPLPPG